MRNRILAAALALACLPALARGQAYDSAGRLLTQTRLHDGSSFIVPALDTTLTARFPSGSTPADAESNGITITRSGAFMFKFNGSTWDRWTGAVTLSQYTPVSGRLPVDGSGVTQPVSWSGQSVTVTQGTGSNLHVAVDSAPSTAVTGTFWPTTAGAPSSARLSDGSAFYDAAKTGQLPSALDGSGYLKTHEQGTAAVNLTSLGGTSLSGADVVDAGNTAFRVNCVTGCTAGGSFSDDSAFTGASTAVSPGGALYDTTPPTITDGSAGAFRMNSSRILYVDLSQTAANSTAVKVDGSAVTQPVSGTFWQTTQPVSWSGQTVTVTQGTGTNLHTVVDSAPTTAVTGTFWPTTAGAPGSARLSDGSAFYDAAKTGQLPAALDGSGYLKVHEQGTPTIANTSFGVTGDVAIVNSTTGGSTQIDVKSTSGIAQLPAALAANGGLKIEGVASGTAVPISGSVTVTQGTGTNLHAVLDSGTTTVTQGTGTNLHTVVDSGTITTVSAARVVGNGGATVDATVAAGTAPTNGVAILGQYKSTLPTLTDTQTAAVQTNSKGQLYTQLHDGTTAVGVIASTTALKTDLASIAGTATPTGNGTAASSLRVTVASDSTGKVDIATPSAIGVYVEDAGETAGGNLMMAGTVRRDTAASSAGTTGDNATLNTDANGLLWTRNGDPCSSGAKTSAPFSISSATTTQLVAASASNKLYVCAFNIVVSAANNVALVEDDTSACASPTAGMAGGTTAATGWNFAANGGLAMGSGSASIMQTAATNRYVCLITSGSAQTSGNLQYVLAP